VRANRAALGALAEYYAVEAKDPERCGAYHAEDITLTFADSPAVTGARVSSDRRRSCKHPQRNADALPGRGAGTEPAL
jgi:hypothetical protein